MSIQLRVEINILNKIRIVECGMSVNTLLKLSNIGVSIFNFYSGENRALRYLEYYKADVSVEDSGIDNNRMREAVYAVLRP